MSRMVIRLHDGSKLYSIAKRGAQLVMRSDIFYIVLIEECSANGTGENTTSLDGMDSQSIRVAPYTTRIVGRVCVVSFSLAKPYFVSCDLQTDSTR